MRWDDLQLLKLIDELEQTEQFGDLRNGLDLLRRAAAGQAVEWGRDEHSFARELLLAHDASYVTWKDQSPRRVGPVAPLANPQTWLRDIWEIRPTLAGRDRARGRVVQRLLPDPSEDDDRPITGMTLEEIARAIGETYTAPQLPRYLTDSGVPVEFCPAERDR